MKERKSLLAQSIPCPKCGHREYQNGANEGQTVTCSQCQSSIPIHPEPGNGKTPSPATRSSFIAPGIVCLITGVLSVVVGVIFLFLVASGGFGLFLTPLFVGFFKLLFFVLPVFLLIASGIPALIAFARSEPRKVSALIVPIISIVWINFLVSVGDSASPPGKKSGGEKVSIAEGIELGFEKKHFGPFGLEFHNRPYLRFHAKKVPLRWLSLPENMELWKDYQVKFYESKEHGDGKVLVASSADFSEEEYLEFFKLLQLHRDEVTDAIDSLKTSVPNVPQSDVAPFRDHVGIVLGEKRRFHSDPPGYLFEVSMDGNLRAEVWTRGGGGKVTGIGGGGFPGHLVVEDGELVLLMLKSDAPSKKGRDMEFYRNLIRSDAAPNELSADWNGPEAVRLDEFAEVREISLRESLMLYEWELSTWGSRTLRFDRSGGVSSNGELWGRWSIPEGELLMLEPGGTAPVRFDEEVNPTHLAGWGRYARVRLLRGSNLKFLQSREKSGENHRQQQLAAGQLPPEPKESTSSFPQSGKLFENALKMKFVPVPKTQESDSAILCAETETTRGEFQKFLDTAAFEFEKLGEGRARTHPIIGVTWDDANSFCEWLTEVGILSGKLAPGQCYRLPTDHEWSRAAGMANREAPDLSPKQKSRKLPGVFLWGDSWPPPQGAGNFSGEELSVVPGKKVIEGFNDGFRVTSPVRSFEPNGLGIYDLAGNLWEWCQDDFDIGGTRKVLRGGSYIQARQLEAATRKPSEPDRKIDHYGFRCVLDLGEARGDFDEPIPAPVEEN